MNYAPLALFVYNRFDFLEQIFLSLQNDPISENTILYIFSDGPKNELDYEKIIAVRKIINREFNFLKVEIFERDTNWGLAKSIENGVTEILERHDRIIVLEDDILPKPGFLEYMNAGLELYEFDEQVMHISAFIYPISLNSGMQTVFYNVNSCWGWGTWNRAWSLRDTSISSINAKLIKNKHYSFRDFNKGQYYAFSKQLKENTSGRKNMWAIKWHSSIYLKGGLCLHPSHSLVTNLGTSSGTNIGLFNFSKRINTDNVPNIKVERIEMIESLLVIKKINRYFWFRNIVARILNYFNVYKIDKNYRTN